MAIQVAVINDSNSRVVTYVRGEGYAGTSSTPDGTVASSRLGAVMVASSLSFSLQMLARSVSPGNTTPAKRAP